MLIDKFAYYANHPQDAQTDGYIPRRQAANKQNIAMVDEREIMILQVEMDADIMEGE